MSRSRAGSSSTGGNESACCGSGSPLSLCLLFDYLPGGELFTHLRQFGRLSDRGARLYAAEIALALEYLHDAPRLVAFRDLKVMRCVDRLGNETYYIRVYILYIRVQHYILYLYIHIYKHKYTAQQNSSKFF